MRVFLPCHAAISLTLVPWVKPLWSTGSRGVKGILQCLHDQDTVSKSASRISPNLATPPVKAGGEWSARLRERLGAPRMWAERSNISDCYAQRLEDTGGRAGKNLPSGRHEEFRFLGHRPEGGTLGVPPSVAREVGGYFFRPAARSL